MAGFLSLRMSRAFDRRAPPDMKAKEHLFATSGPCLQLVINFMSEVLHLTTISTS
jgi:hypothetical protein